jgi:hypothetical protein
MGKQKLRGGGIGKPYHSTDHSLQQQWMNTQQLQIKTSMFLSAVVDIRRFKSQYHSSLYIEVTHCSHFGWIWLTTPAHFKCCIAHTNLSRRQGFVYPIQHGHECC